MPDINITVAHKVAVSDTQSIVCDNSDYTVNWTLDEEWIAYDTKTMRTIYMDGTFMDTVFSGNVIALPVCTVPGVVQIGLYAGNLRTSRVAILRALPSVRSAAGAPADPTPDVYDQLMEIIKGLGGTDPDDIAKAVADYLAAHPIEETDPTVPEWAKAEITGATVGQIAKIAAVDESGAPTAWEPVDMPGGGGAWEKIIDTEVMEATPSFTCNGLNCNEIYIRWSKLENATNMNSAQDLYLNNTLIMNSAIIVNKSGGGVYGWTLCRNNRIVWAAERSDGAIDESNLRQGIVYAPYNLISGVGTATTLKLETPDSVYAPITGKLEVWVR